LRVRVKEAGTVVAPDEDLDDASPIGSQPSQGAYADDQFGVEWETEVSVKQNGTSQLAFLGAGSLGGPSASIVPPGLTETGDYVGGMVETLGASRNSAAVSADIVGGSIVVQANQVITTKFENFVTIFRNDPEDQSGSDTPPPFESPADGLEIGGAGSMVVDLELVDQSGTYKIRLINVPALSPPVIAVLLLGLLAGGMVVLRRGVRGRSSVST
jgi:hypothetical protein